MRYIFLTMVLISTFSLQVGASLSQEKLVDENCNELPSSCQINRDCAAEASSRSSSNSDRNCNRCLLTHPWGGCAVRGNDPLCEAQKAAQNAIADAERGANKIDCERQKEAALLQCRARLAIAIADCKVQKTATTGNSDISIFQRLLASGGDGENKQIPEAVVIRLSQSGLYDVSLLKNMKVVQLGASDVIPKVFSDAETGFTVGNKIFLKDINNVSNIPLEFWVRQLEISKLFSEYGTSEFGKAIETSPNTIFSLVNGKVSKNCASLGC